MEQEATIEEKLFQSAKEQRIPIYGVLELLPLCNMNCDMCYVRLNQEEVKKQGRIRSVDEWLSLAKEMKEAGVLFLLLTGGEPLLYPDFQKLYIELRRMGMIVTINTNGTLIDETWAIFFEKNKPRRINITLYGGSDKIYNELCHNSRGFTKAMNGIRLLQKHKIDVKINGSLVKANMEDRIKIIKIGETLGIPVRIDTYMYPALRERTRGFVSQVRLTPETAAFARVEVLKREMGEKVFLEYAMLTIETVKNTSQIENQSSCMKCKAGSCSFVINWQGELRPCIVMDTPSVPVFEVGFQRAWKRIVEETQKIRINKKCQNCRLRKVCNTCAAASMAEKGSFDAVPEYICEYTKKTVELLKKELEERKRNGKNIS